MRHVAADDGMEGWMQLRDAFARWPMVLTTALVVVSGCATGTSQVATPGTPPPPASPAPASTRPSATPAAPAAPASPERPSPGAGAVGPGEPWIVYQHWTQATGNTLRLIRPDGTGDHALLPPSPLAQLHPDWSPDGQRIAYATDNDIWTVNADGTDPTLVFDCALPCVYGNDPAWSPDGRTIAFITGTPDGDTAGQTAMAVDLATGTSKVLYESVGAEFPAYVRWSPDGTAVVLDLVRYPDDKVDSNPVIGEAIAVLDLKAATPKARLLTEWSMFATYPDWSWATDRIVFSTYDLAYRDFHVLADYAPPSDLYAIDPDGTNSTQLTRNASGTTLVRDGTASGPLSGQPTWTPDGSAVIFTQVEGDAWPGWGLATISADGTGLTPAAGPTIVVGGHARLRPTVP